MLTGAVALVAGAIPMTSTAASAAERGDGRTYTRLENPARVVVSDARGELATFTVGARTVTLRGPRRTFAEPSTTSASVTTRTWVRMMASPFAGRVNRRWLDTALALRTPDVLATAAQYLPGSPTLTDSAGRRVSSDASYGPLSPEGPRTAGADFNDYLGVEWEYPGMSDQPEAAQVGSLDCSGFVRMVLGYRHGVPLTYESDGVGLPRRAVQMSLASPGIVVVPDSGSRAVALGGLLPGDLVFSDVVGDDGTQIDHVGIYLGRDSAGAARFVSSRRTADGPTMGDVGGRSTVSGTGLYAQGFRMARRV